MTTHAALHRPSSRTAILVLAAMPEGGGTAGLVLRADTSQNITSFGESEAGELFAVTGDGKLYRVLAP